MDYLPQDPFMLISSINMLLRDGEYETLEDICASFDRNEEEIKTTLLQHGYIYNETQKQVIPADCC